MKKGLPLALALVALGLILVVLLLPQSDPEEISGAGRNGASNQDGPGTINGASGDGPNPRDQPPRNGGGPASAEALGPMLSGQVRTEGNQPIGEAVVTLHDLQRGLPTLHLTQTDFGGNYEMTAREVGNIADVSPGVSATAPGRARIVHPLPTLPPGVSLTEDFTLAPEQPFAGRIIWDGDGEPVANADLFAHTGIQRTHPFTFSAGRSDGLGEFSLGHLLGENMISLEVRPAGESVFRQAGSQGHGEGLTFVLSRGTARVVGRVINHGDGKAVPDVPVWIGNAVNGPDAYTSWADDEGAFHFEDIPLGQWSASVPTHPDDAVMFVLQDEDEERAVTIRLGATVPFDGIAIDLDTGEPVPSLRLRARDSSHSWVPSVTDGEGRFQVRGLSGLEGEAPTTPDRSLRIMVDSDQWFFPSGERESEVRVSMRGAAPVPIQLGLHRGVPMTIRAFDRSDQPVPGVNVAVLTSQTTQDSGPTEIGETGPDGTLLVPVPRIPSPLQFLGFGEDRPYLSEPTETTAEEAILRELPLLPVEVHVTDAAERVVAGANVTITMEIPLVNFEMRGELQDTQQTDELGVASFSEIPASPVKVSAVARAVANTTPPAVTARFDLSDETDPVRIDLQFDEVLRYPIAGTVLDAISEAAIEGATVNWSTRDVHGTIRPGNAVTTDADGHFEVITDADQIWLNLQVTADGYETRETEHWLLDLPEPVIRLGPLPRLVGQVVPPPQQPDQVLFTLWNLEEFDGNQLWTLKAAQAGESFLDAGDGFFEWQVSTADIGVSNRLMVFAPTDRVATMVFGLEESADGTLFYLGELNLVAGQPVEGLVVTAGGNEPIENATVIFERHRADLMEGRTTPALQAVTHTAGDFTLQPIPAGPWRVRAGAEGYKPALEEIVVPLAENLVIELEPLVGSTLTLSITAPEGGALQSGVVRIWDPEGGLDPDDMDPLIWQDEARAIQGQVRFEDIPLSRALVQITRTGTFPHFGHRYSKPLPNAENHDDVDLSTWIEVTGRVTDSTRRPIPDVPNAVVELTSTPITEERHTWGVSAPTNTQGQYLLRLPPGEYQAEVNGIPHVSSSGNRQIMSVPNVGYSLIYDGGL